MNGYRARDGVIEVGPVSLGERVFVGEGTLLDIHSAIENGGQIAHSSSLHAGQTIPAGQGLARFARRAGSRGHEVPHRRDHPHPSARRSPLRRVPAPLPARHRWAAGRLRSPPCCFSRVGLNIPVAIDPVLAGVITSAGCSVGLIAAVAIPRLVARALKPGRVYPLYGAHYMLQRLSARASNNPVLTGLFGDSCAIPHYLRLIGWRFGILEQTGSNFGLEVKHDTPGLCEIGTGTMVSDGLSMMNAEFSSTSFRVRPVKVGKRNFLGNVIRFPAAAHVGDNCLLATKVMIPTSGRRHSNVGLLGSPAFEIPRTVERDRQFEEISSGRERERALPCQEPPQPRHGGDAPAGAATC